MIIVLGMGMAVVAIDPEVLGLGGSFPVPSFRDRSFII
jgi:hypothetical protein